MANLTNSMPSASYGALLTIQTSGISNILANVQDGYGNNTALQLANNACAVTGNLNITGSLQVNGQPISGNGAAFTLPALAADPALSPTGQGQLYFNSTHNQIKYSINGGAWTALTLP